MATGVFVSEEERQALHNPRLHAESLTRLGSERLIAGDAYGAFIFADRRCRIAMPNAHDLILRSEALLQLGFAAAAATDLERAVGIDATDPLVTRRLMNADDETADAAARWVIADQGSAKAAVDDATRHLLRRGIRVVGSIVVDRDQMTGWVSWHGQRIYALRIETQQGQHVLRLPPRGGDAASETVPAPQRLSLKLPAPFVDLSVASDDRPFAAAYVAVRVNPLPSWSPGEAAKGPAIAAGRLVTVIVPIYEDVEITRACLAALAVQLKEGIVLRVVLVNDAAPDPAMTALLVEMSGRHGFELIVNRRNLGFIGAVNRALDQVTSGDVVLLNADVLLPPRAIVKLAAAAHSRPGLGIVNPLTNNGQFNSFPAVFGTNALPDQSRIDAIDAVAERVAGGVLAPTPGGIGYCMYVTRACLDAVGRVPEVYLRGYYEDVEFTLRASERGFATVCAPNIYAGHKGTVSFKDEKKRLVARNERVNNARFPRHAANCRAYQRADPLRALRGAIEAQAFPQSGADVVVAGSALYRPVLRARAAGLARGSQAVVMLSWSALNGAVMAQLQRHGDPEPRQTVYPLDPRSAQADLVTAIQALKPARIEVAGNPGLFGPTLEALRRQGLAFGALLCESNGCATTLHQRCPSPDEPEPCAACIDHLDRHWTPRGIGVPLHRTLMAGEPPPMLFVPMDAMAQELATDLESDGFANSRFERFAAAAPTPAARPEPSRAVLALPYPEPDGATERLIGALAALARRRLPAWSVVLLGRGLDDGRIMSVGNVFVTGPMADDDYDAALLHYGAAALLAPQRWSGFGLLTRLAGASGLPKGFFDWSIGAVPAQTPDLAIDPRVCDAKAADAVCLWLDGLALRRAA